MNSRPRSLAQCRKYIAGDWRERLSIANWTVDKGAVVEGLRSGRAALTRLAQLEKERVQLVRSIKHSSGSIWDAYTNADPQRSP